MSICFVTSGGTSGSNWHVPVDSGKCHKQCQCSLACGQWHVSLTVSVDSVMRQSHCRKTLTLEHVKKTHPILCNVFSFVCKVVFVKVLCAIKRAKCIFKMLSDVFKCYFTSKRYIGKKNL